MSDPETNSYTVKLLFDRCYELEGRLNALKEKYLAVQDENKALRNIIKDQDEEVEQIIEERDEARRSVCNFEHRYNIAYPKEDWMMTFGTPEQAAEYHGWDCFKEKRDG